LIGDREIDADEAWRVQHQASQTNDLLVWTVTTGTKDYGDKFVARPNAIRGGPRPLPVVLIADTLETLQKKLPVGLFQMPRQIGDDPVIIETWV